MAFEQMLSAEKKRPELYDVLGCDRTSSIAQITAEYRAKVRDLHPDKQTDTDTRDRFISLQQAYDTLSDESQRRLYDSWLDSPMPISLEEFKKNSDIIRMSMHWITPKSTPMIPGPAISPPPNDSMTRWSDGRYESEAAKRFRNYEI